MTKALFKRLVALLNLQEGKPYNILDIGCGRGELLEEIALVVGAGSHLAGIDAMPAVIEAAQAKSPSIDYHSFRFTDRLPFADAEFDIVLSVDMLECIVNKGTLLHEVARILKPHGQVIFAHWDWDTQVYASEHTQLIREFIHAFADWQQDWMDASDGMMGRKLWGLFQSTKQFEGLIEVFTLLETSFQPGLCGYDRLQDLQALVDKQVISSGDYQCILEEMDTLSREGRYFYSLNSYIYTGKKML
jgi:SAM-dependent methyltransferase